MAVAPDITGLINEIRDDRLHGAIELARKALRVLQTATENSQVATSELFLEEMREIGRELTLARPPMAPIRNIVDRLLEDISGKAAAGDAGWLRECTLSRIDELISESVQAFAKIISQGRHLIDAGDRIMTHSYSSTVVALLQESASRPGDMEVIVTRSGPGRTGEKIVRCLVDSGLNVTFIDDTALGLYVPSVNKVLLGADTVFATGVLNGVGSYQLAVLAARHSVPVYILTDTLKFDKIAGGGEFDVEDRDVAELADPVGLAKRVSIRNPHFDVTPLELITGIVTEQGLMTPDTVIAYLK